MKKLVRVRQTEGRNVGRYSPGAIYDVPDDMVSQLWLRSGALEAVALSDQELQAQGYYQTDDNELRWLPPKEAA